MQLLISLSAILCFSVLAGVSFLRLWLNYQQSNVLKYDSAYKEDKNNPDNRIDQTPKSFYATSIHNYSKMLFGFGLMVSSALVLYAFTWQTEEEQNLISYEKPIMEDEIFDLPPITDILPPPPPKIQPINPTEIVEVDKVDFDESLVKINMEELEIQIDDLVSDVTDIDKNNFQSQKVEELFYIVEEPAIFEGGMDAFYKYVAKNINYPKQAKRQGIEGKVFLQFVVDKDGSVTAIKVAKGVGFGLDEEAKRVLSECPKWKPARQRGQIVKVRMSIPIMFKLD
ncbi:energy transducer TonB [Bernardetia sp. ABR2-2B]|uniref:energy transducer TonB n=1 Tax=Bernardetia sp. ABR2-2B TaxID=3127472 RepID=UPI0030D48269